MILSTADTEEDLNLDEIVLPSSPYSVVDNMSSATMADATMDDNSDCYSQPIDAVQTTVNGTVISCIRILTYLS